MVGVGSDRERLTCQCAYLQAVTPRNLKAREVQHGKAVVFPVCRFRPACVNGLSVFIRQREYTVLRQVGRVNQGQLGVAGAVARLSVVQTAGARCPAGLLLGRVSLFHGDFRNVKIHCVAICNLFAADTEAEFNFLYVCARQFRDIPQPISPGKVFHLAGRKAGTVKLIRHRTVARFIVDKTQRRLYNTAAPAGRIQAHPHAVVTRPIDPAHGKFGAQLPIIGTVAVLRHPVRPLLTDAGYVKPDDSFPVQLVPFSHALPWRGGQRVRRRPDGFCIQHGSAAQACLAGGFLMHGQRTVEIAAAAQFFDKRFSRHSTASFLNIYIIFLIFLKNPKNFLDFLLLSIKTHAKIKVK